MATAKKVSKKVSKTKKKVSRPGKKTATKKIGFFRNDATAWCENHVQRLPCPFCPTEKKPAKKAPVKKTATKKKRTTARVMPFAAAFCTECEQRYPKTLPARGGLFHEVWCSKYPQPAREGATVRLKEAFAEFEREYRTEIDAICDDIANEIKVGRIDDRDALEVKIHELLDGHAYMLNTDDSLAVLRVSDYDAAAIDNLGVEGLVTDNGINYGSLVYCAMEADVHVRLDWRGITNDGEPVFPPGELDDEEGEGESNAENGAGGGAGTGDCTGGGSRAGDVAAGRPAGAVGGPAIVDGVVGRYIGRRELEVDAGAGGSGAGGGDPAAGSVDPDPGPADGADDA